ncbi:hypothetical protein RJ639_038539 [Escallonia herrerae]|uniref:Dof zinc finger protein n=1 Tax=Escallonia herrerae TaxID=1293975 RepID=A0AA88WL71_9ASTE|nr:hypothetical protein RJ639_038539 [Escallonia herrerae]
MFSTVSDHQMLHCPPRQFDMESRWKPSVEIAPNCPRCASTNTKFCYYNNYSLSQPRYFCKGCRRYWTKGGSLRNVPVGGGCRKNRRSRSARSSLPTSSFARHPPSPGKSSSVSSVVSRDKANNVPSNIDLAAVFAKYLNQDSGLENEVVGEESSSAASSESFDLQLNSLEVETQLENIMMECQLTFDLIEEGQLHEEFPRVLVDEDTVQKFPSYTPNAFQLETVVGDELPQDISWSEDATLPNLAWQPMAQFQEFGSFLPDDQTKIPTNLFHDNWTAFDPQGYM